MKIGVLTLPLHSNYGGNLQCFALCRVLKDLGFEVENIYLKFSLYQLPFWKLPFSYTKRIIYKLIGKNKSPIKFEKFMNEKWKEYTINTQFFIEKNIPNSKEIYTSESLNQIPYNKYDVLIVGSDQVWRYNHGDLHYSIENFFFDFLPDGVKRISYAASFGVDKVEYSKKSIHKCGKLIGKFSAISVRENSGIDLIKNVYAWKCVEPKQVLDPTLLLNKEDYQTLINKSIKHDKDLLFYYILDMDNKKKKLIDTICHDFQLKPFTVIGKPFDKMKPHQKWICPSTEEWLSGFIKCKYVLTDSFHGCVFSIIFNKPFIVIGNKERGLTRFNSLLTTFNLKNQYISDDDEYNKAIIVDSIDWDMVNHIKEIKRDESISFLTKSLKS